LDEDMEYDVAIIGSGISGSSLAAILARHGQRVIVFEAKSHPRFAIGESLILETSEMMRALAEFYDVPELAYYSAENYAAFQGTSHGVKRHFGFLHHTAAQPHDPRHTLQAVIPKEPHGHELHLYRQDTDYFLATTAVAYGATLLQNTPITDIALAPDYATITSAQGQQYRAQYVVDGGGFRSLLAQKFGLRDYNLQTHARGLFTHMVNVPCYHQANQSQQAYGLPFRMSEGTLHHVFPGGWLWVIPFDNHAHATNPLCSVGLMLDPRIHPAREDLTPEEEFRAFIAQYPSIAAQFEGARATREWTRAGRIQYNSTQIVGDRWALMGHAAGFIDPLFSKGLYISSTAVFLLAHLLLKAKETGDYSAAAFADLERVTHDFVRSADRLVANSYKSFSHYRLWQVYAVLWLLGAYTEYVKLNMMRLQAGGDRAAYVRQLVGLKLVGGGFADFAPVANQVDELIAALDVTDEAAVTATISKINQIFRQLDWMPAPFIALLEGKTYLPRNKLRLGLLRPSRGFMGQGAYRRHFFGGLTLIDLLRYGLREKIGYSRFYLTWRHGRAYRQRTA
jgi:tetracycline 7-halogenase / FADH2 O2-dependent halogenase